MPKNASVSFSDRSARWPASPISPVIGRIDQQDHERDQRHLSSETDASSPLTSAPPNSSSKDHHRQPFDLLGDVVHVVMEIVRSVRPAKRQRGDEHREKAVAMDDLGKAVGDARRGQRDQPVAGLRQLGLAPGHGRSASQRRDRSASRRRCPRRFPTTPGSQPLTQPWLAAAGSGRRQHDREMDERKGEAHR